MSTSIRLRDTISVRQNGPHREFSSGRLQKKATITVASPASWRSSFSAISPRKGARVVFSPRFDWQIRYLDSVLATGPRIRSCSTADPVLCRSSRVWTLSYPQGERCCEKLHTSVCPPTRSFEAGSEPSIAIWRLSVGWRCLRLRRTFRVLLFVRERDRAASDELCGRRRARTDDHRAPVGTPTDCDEGGCRNDVFIAEGNFSERLILRE